MTTIMPRSPVVDAARNARPEWREYLGSVETAIKALEALGLDGGALEVVAKLKERLEAVKVRIAALPEKAVNKGERLVMWRGTVVNSSGQATFSHDLGTRHVWWQIRNVAAGGALVCSSFEAEVTAYDEGSIRLNVGPGTFDAIIFGVISDRY